MPKQEDFSFSSPKSPEDDTSQQENTAEVPESIEAMRSRITEKIRQEAGDLLEEEDPEKATFAYDATLTAELEGSVDSYYGEAFKSVDKVLPRVISEVRGGVADDAMFTQVAEVANIPSARLSFNRAHDLGMELAFAVIDESEELTERSHDKRVEEARRRIEDASPEDKKNREIVNGVITRRRAERALDPEAQANDEKLDTIRKFLNEDETPPDSKLH